MAKAKQDFEDYKRITENRFQDDSAPPDINPSVSSIKKLPDDLSGHVTFLHPWMNEVLNQMVLMLMFGILAIMTLIVLRLKDN